jgi:sirohydrochlorin cobaltochelatase
MNTNTAAPTPPAAHPHPANLNSQAILVLAHGSRDPLWRLPVEQLVQRLRGKAPQQPVACAYIELCEPDFATACQDLIQQAPHLQSIKVLPLFFGVGRHAREDMPLLVQAAQAAHPHIQWTLLPSAGEMPRVMDCLADAVLA